MLAFSEGPRLAERDGIDPRLAIEVIASSSISSPMLKGRAPLMLALAHQYGLALPSTDADSQVPDAGGGAGLRPP
jgi:3-hydroxyisobutyrate dehydrogenase-like beta-hydroxyacid dehydrogenase